MEIVQDLVMPNTSEMRANVLMGTHIILKILIMNMISLKPSHLNLHLTIQSMKSNLKIQILRLPMKRLKKMSHHKKKQIKRVDQISLKKFYLIQRTIRVHQNKESR